MAKLALNIVADIKDVEEKVASIKKKLTEIGSNPIKIRVDASGLDAISQKIKVVTDAEIRAAEAAAKLANAEARKINAETRAAESAAKLANAQEKAAKAAAQAASAQEGLSTSTALVIKNVGTLEAKITSLTRAYNQLAEAQRRLDSGGGGGGMTNGSERNALPSPGALVPSGSRTIEWSGYGDYRDSAIDVDWTPVVDGANAASEAVNRAGNAASGATGGFRRLADMIKNVGQNSEGLVGTLHQYIEWYLRWTVVSGAFKAAVGSIKEALQTMKAVDDELVTVRKVTGFTADEMKRVEEQAYKTASAYGVAANEYLESVTAFARAGYKEQSEALAELSTKTQIVGDTTAEVANQFLLSTDAAYKYGGSIEELSKVLDGANELDNKYATSISKIAEGMGIVAPVAAQMNVSIDELAAAIGTITAVTQRSGSEAARALRALFLNIAGDTKTEIDEGVTWTTGEIEGLRDVIKMYASDVYEAAQATHSVINPMEAMAALANAMKEGTLHADDLVQMVSDIGGKLRSSQLLAIIQNWDMYQSMLQDYAGAIGSADREVENALDSWSRKTAQLKNAWTEFISHVVETKDIKNAVDLLTGAVKLLDTNLGQAVVKVGLLFAALKISGVINGIITLVQMTSAAMAGLVTATEAFTTVWATSPFMVVAIGAAAVYGIVKAVDALSVSYKEQQEILNDLNKQYDKQFGSGSEYDTLRKKADDLTASERERLIFLRGQEQALKGQVEEAKKLAAEKWLNENSRNTQWTPNVTANGDLFYDTTKTSTKNLRELTTEVDKASDAYFNLEAGIERYTDSLGKAIAPFKDYYDGLVNAKDAGMELNEEEEEFIRVYENAAAEIGRATTAIENDTKAKDENAAATQHVEQANGTLKKAFEEVESKSSLTYGTLEELDRLYPGLSKKILDVNGNLTAEGQAALASKNAFVELIAQAYIFNNTSLDVSGKISALYELASAAGLAGNMIAGIANPGEAEAAVEYAMSMGLTREQAEKSVLSGYQQRFIKGLNDTEYASPPPSGYGGGTGELTEEEKQAQAQQEELKRLQQIVADEKARYTWMEAQGKSQAELDKQAKVIQDALHNQAEYMRGVNTESGKTVFTFAAIAALSKEWLDWQKKIADAAQKAEEEKAKAEEEAQKAAEKAAEEEQKRLDEAQKAELQSYKDKVDHWKSELDFLEASGASEEERIAAMREIQNALHNQADYLRTIEGESDNVRALSTEWWNIQNDILSITDKIAQKLKDEVKSTVDEIVGTLEAESNATINALQAEIDLLKEQHSAAEDAREEEEKRLAVVEARIALENAQSERNVRQYNASTGQWEWVANEKNVQAAREQLASAEAALAKYEEEQEYQKRLAELEAQKENTKNAFDLFKEAMQKFSDAVSKILDSPKLNENAKRKFVDDIKKILTAPTLPADVKTNFISAMESILSAPELSDQVKAQFISDISTILDAPDLDDNAKQDFVSSITKILEAPTLSPEIKTQFISRITDILTAPNLGKDVKTSFINAMKAILTAPTLSDNAKSKLIDGIVGLFNNNALKADVKKNIADAITTLIGKADDAESAVDVFKKYIENALKTKNPGSAIGELYDAIKSGVVNLNDIGVILAALNGEYASISTDAAKMLALSKMQANSVAWHMTEDVNTRNALHDENVQLGNKLGLTYNSQKGTWSDVSGQQVYTLSNIGGDWLSELNDKISFVQELIDAIDSKPSSSGSGSGSGSGSNVFGGNAIREANRAGYAEKAASNAGAGTTKSAGSKTESSTRKVIRTWRSGAFNYKEYSDGTVEAYTLAGTRVYDRGGVLHGLGGIKATTEDEMVLPPAMTRALLNAEANGAFKALLDDLGIVTAAANGVSGIGGGVRANSIGEQNNGDNYNFGNISLSEQQARGMSVYELAQLGRTLALQRGS